MHRVQGATRRLHAAALGFSMLALGACTPGGVGSAGSGGGATCGNAVLEPPEECDIGTLNGEGHACTAMCTLARCGDGVVGPGEECDDGNDIDNDGCSNSCTLPVPCGNGVVDDGEECDDGNSDDTDDCTSACVLPTCGDGFVHAGIEECDDGVHNSDYAPNACRTICLLPRCGDLVVDKGEECDAGAANSDSDADACRTNCQAARCGDGTLDTNEGCDVGVANSDTDADACRTNCQPASCGDGVTDAGEECDDAGDSATCNANCTVAACGDGYANAAANEQCDDAGDSLACDSDCTPRACGDGYLNTVAGEQCEVGAMFAHSTCTLDTCQLVCLGTYDDCTTAPGCETDLSSAANHCGACGHDCGGGVCSVGRCQPMKLADLGTVASTADRILKLFNGDLYVATTTGLARVSASATTATTPTTYPNVKPMFGAFVPLADSVYFFTTTPSFGLYVAPLADTTATPTFLASGFAATLDADATHFYYADNATGTAVELYRFPIGGAAPETVAILPPQANAFGGFALDASGTQVYFSQSYSNTTELWRANKDPGNPMPTLVATSSTSLDLALDATWAYWPVSGALKRVARDPYACLPDPICPAETFYAVSGIVSGLAVDSSHLYWTERSTKLIWRVPLVGGSAEAVFPIRSATPTTVVVTAQYVYWLEVAYASTTPPPDSGTGAIWKWRK